MKPLCVVVLLSWINVSYTCPSACSCSDNTMNCDSKNLEEIPAGIPATIETLNLCNNQITNISAQVFEGLSALTSLSLCNNQITTISPQAFVGLSSLLYVACSCSHNTMNCYYKNLEEIPSGIPATTQKLILSNNQITNISAQVFEGLSALEYLYLSNNQITTISPQAFVGLSSLEYFACSCSHNTMNCYYKNLEEIPSGIPATTQKLSLSNNQITTISPQAFVGLSSLAYLELENNPLDCSSCDLETFKVFLNNQTHLRNADAKCNGTNTYVVNHDFQNCGGGMATTDAMMTTDDMTTTDELTTTDDMTTLVDNSANNRGSSEVGSIGAVAVVTMISVLVAYACSV